MISSHYKRSALPQLLNASRHLIVVYCKMPKVPGREDWVKLVSWLMEPEEWMAQCNDKYDKFYSIWAKWNHYNSGVSEA